MSYKKDHIKGLYVPLVTPFKADESIDYDAYKTIIDYVIDNGMDGVLVGGTTGEYHVMSVEERKELIKKGCEIVAGRVPVVAGTGMPTAKATKEMNDFAAACGAKYGLVLPPYYHQTTEEGIYEFYKEVAEDTKVGIIVYYTPDSTAVTMSPQLLARIAALDGIAAVKETVDETHTSNTYMATLGIPDFTIMEANEPLLIPSYAIGIEAAFSICFNLIPKEMREMYDLVFKKNDIAAARELNKKLYPIFAMMEEEPYPGPVKAGLDAIGLPGGIVRKPLPQPTESIRKRMKEELGKIGYKTV